MQIRIRRLYKAALERGQLTETALKISFQSIR